MKKIMIAAAALGLLSTTAFADNFNYPVNGTVSSSTSKSFIYPGQENQDYVVSPAGSTSSVTRTTNLNNDNEPQHNLKDYIIENNN